MRYLLLLLTVAACGGTDSTAPAVVVDPTVGGTYTATLHTDPSGASRGPSCGPVTVTLPDGPAVAQACGADWPHIQLTGAVAWAGDTLVLETSGVQSRPLRFYGPRLTQWDGVRCWPLPTIGCIKEYGSVTWQTNGT